MTGVSKVGAASAAPGRVVRLLSALGRHAHQLACEASRTTDGTVADLLAADRAHVLSRIDGLEAAVTVAHFGAGGLNEPASP